MSSAQRMQESTLAQRVARFFRIGRLEPKKEEEEGDIFQKIEELEGSPFQCLLIEQNSYPITCSGDPRLIDMAVSILADNSRYDVLARMMYSKSVSERAKRLLTPQQTIEVGKKMADRGSSFSGLGDYVAALSVLEGITGAEDLRTEINAGIKGIVIKPGFYRSEPVTALKYALSIDDPEAIGTVFAHIRESVWQRSSYKDNEEMRELVGKFTDFDRLRELSNLFNQTEIDEERTAIWDEERKLRDEFEEELYGMVKRGSGNAEKAFIVAGELFMGKKVDEKSEPWSVDYHKAMEFFIAGRNPEKIVEAMREMSEDVAKGNSSMYDAADNILRGAKALMRERELYDLPSKPDTIAEASQILERTFSSYDVYFRNPKMAIEAAEMLGDFVSLKNNFYRSVQKGYGICPDVYKALKEKGHVSYQAVIIIAEENLGKIAAGGMDIPPLHGVIEAAELVEEISLNKDLLAAAIGKTSIGLSGCSSDAVKVIPALEYMRRRGMLSPAEENFCDALKQKKH